MAQEKENWTQDSDILALIPKASTDVNPGDVVVMPRRNDPVSLSQLGATPGRIEPIAAAREGQWSVGVVDGLFTSAAVGATLYATPTQSGAMKVRRRGIVRLAISDTAGKAGDLVRYSSGDSGAQIFVRDNRRSGWAVARISKDFTGASANDPQYCELIEQPLGGPNLYHFLENRVIDGCNVRLHAAPGSQVEVGQIASHGVNAIILQNRLKTIAQDVTLAFGGVGSAAASTVRFKYVVARSASFAIRSGSSTKAALASFTVAGVTIGLLVPVTMTAGEIPIALLIQFSAATQSAARIINLRGPNLVPNVGSWGV